MSWAFDWNTLLLGLQISAVIFMTFIVHELAHYGTTYFYTGRKPDIKISIRGAEIDLSGTTRGQRLLVYYMGIVGGLAFLLLFTSGIFGLIGNILFVTMYLVGGCAHDIKMMIRGDEYGA